MSSNKMNINKENDNYNIDKEFAMPKDRPVKIIFITFLFLIIIGISIFYFYFDNPKMILKYVLDNQVSKLETILKSGDTKKLIDYSLSFDLESNNNEYDEIFKIINKFEFAGGAYKFDDEEYIRFNVKYDSYDLPDVSFNLKEDMLYFRSKDLYDKVIKLGNIEKDTDYNKNDDKQVDSKYEKIMNSLVNSLADSVVNGKFSKKYFIEDKKIYKKVNDEILYKDVFNRIIGNYDFLYSLSDLLGVETSDIIDLFKEGYEKNKDLVFNISLETNLLNTEIYNVKIETDSISFGISFDEKDKVKISYVDYNELLNVNIFIEYENKDSVKIDEFDIDNSIDIDDVKDADKVIENLMNNKGFKQILTDIGVNNDNNKYDQYM